jgi:hypothetical protein
VADFSQCGSLSCKTACGTPDGLAFVQRMRSFSQATLRSFREIALGVKVHVFRNIAVAIAAAEMIENDAEANRNVEMLLFVKSEGTWRIVSPAWDRKPYPIPSRRAHLREQVYLMRARIGVAHTRPLTPSIARPGLQLGFASSMHTKNRHQLTPPSDTPSIAQRQAFGGAMEAAVAEGIVKRRIGCGAMISECPAQTLRPKMAGRLISGVILEPCFHGTVQSVGSRNS